ncbi:hypothetical protein Tsubulata_020667 [Turnera subulata]|uniref:Nascent polypeptide-associated complex subunit beta n=1 Tax=Turnera subulata TaxID=218843 RepID=A0A9Q0G7L7_9ROSI|nr:hypothetical protein Tsubulata_020667 [Turnera subulata]
MDREKLMKMAASVRTGGKGTVRRKKKAVHKSTTTDDKKLQSTLKRIGVNTIPAIEEVNIFKDDVVIQFLNPKVQASIVANTWVVTGSPQTRSMSICFFSLCPERMLMMHWFPVVSIIAGPSSRTHQPTRYGSSKPSSLLCVLSCVCHTLEMGQIFHVYSFSRPDNLDNLRKLAEQFQKEAPNAGAGAAQEEDDDEVPDLVAGETFEAAAEEKST